MPCYDPEAEAASERELQRRLDAATRLLCGLCQRIDVSHRPCEIDDVHGLRNWWEVHKRMDEERRAEKEREQRHRDLRRSAIARLTPEERKALGLR